MHFHRDVLAVADTFSAHVLKPTADDVFTGTPPLAFTFGLGAMLIFPIRAGAATLLIERATPAELADHIAARGVTVVLHRADRLPRHAGRGQGRPAARAAPAGIGRRDAARIGVARVPRRDRRQDHRRHRQHRAAAHLHLRRRRPDQAGIDRAAGARLPRADPRRRRRASTGRRARPAGGQGPDRLPVPGRRPPAQLRQRRLELHRRHVHPRRGRLLLVPGALGRHDRLLRLQHRRPGGRGRAAAASRWWPSAASWAFPTRPAVRSSRPSSCWPAARRRPEKVAELQDLVKRKIAPYKYPRAIDFLPSLPRTNTGKLQRFKLRDLS